MENSRLLVFKNVPEGLSHFIKSDNNQLPSKKAYQPDQSGNPNVVLSDAFSS